MRLRELVYADHICLLATSPAELQALIDALAIYFGALHIEINIPKTKVMSFFAEQAPITAFMCNGLLYCDSVVDEKPGLQRIS